MKNRKVLAAAVLSAGLLLAPTVAQASYYVVTDGQQYGSGQSNSTCTQLSNGNVCVTGVNSMEDLKSKLSAYGIDPNQFDLGDVRISNGTAYCKQSTSTTQPSTAAAPTQPATTAAPKQPATTAAPKQPATTAAPKQPAATAAPTQPSTTKAAAQSTTAAQTTQPATTAAPTTQQGTTAAGSSNSSYVSQVVTLVNEERAKAGLAALTVDSKAEAAAAVRAKEIMTSFSHTRPNGSSFSTALKEQGASYSTAGENIAWGQKTPQEVVTGWMNSSGHRANILGANYTKIGCGFYQGSDGTCYWSQLFIG